MRSPGFSFVLGAMSLVLLETAPSVGARPYDEEDGPRAHSNHGKARGNWIVNTAMHDNYFEAEKLNVPVGTTVQWRNAGEHVHTVTGDSKTWDSGKVSPGEVVRHTFDRPGTFPYHCAMHPKAMRGVVVVKGEAGGRGPARLSTEPADRAKERTRAPADDGIEVSGPLDVPPPRRAVIRVRLPQTWADVSFDGRKIDEVGKLRTYVTPELPEARTFQVTATWKHNGRTRHREKSVTVAKGQVRTLDFTSGK